MFITTYAPVNYNRINYTQPIYTKTRNNYTDTVSFSERALTQDEREIITKELHNKMNTRPESVQELYQYGIDFLTGEIDKTTYLDWMYNLLEKRHSKWGITTRDESKFIGNYGLTFDEGAGTESIPDSDILDCLKLLLGH